MNVTSAGTLCNNIHEVNENHKNSFQIIDILSKKNSSLENIIKNKVWSFLWT